MKQTIEIEVPDGKEAVYDEYTKSIKFVDKKPIISKSWEEFIANHPSKANEWYISNNSNITQLDHYDTFERCKLGDENVLATKEDAEGILALIQLTRLHDEWVDDWAPDYINSNVKKYHIVIQNNTIDISEDIWISALLSFPTLALATEFMQCFKDLIIKAKRFI